MPVNPSCFHRFIRLPLAALLASAALAVPAQTGGAPERIARFEATEGSVQFQSAADQQIRLADPAWPLSAGDRLWTAIGSRAELHAGSASLRLGDGTELGLSALDESNNQFKLTAGTLGLVIRQLSAGERFEVDTPNLALVIDRPGRWRVDVDRSRNTTRVIAEQGGGTVYGENGQGLAIVAPQSRDFTQKNLAATAPAGLPVADAFDRWSGERERILAQSPSIRYASAAIPGVAQLDAYGDWNQDARYGAIWYPRNVASDWSPFSSGRWEWIAPWGWTWIDNAPWGFAPSHYGRWAQAGNRWGWIPGPPQGRPGYAAAPPFSGNRPRIPDGYGSGRPPSYPMAPARIGAAIEPLADQVRRDQWEQNQRARQDQHQADMLRQQQLREAQRRFQPSYGQQQLEDQRRQIELQQQQLMFQQQRQQQDQMRQQQWQQQQQMQQLQMQQEQWRHRAEPPQRQPMQQPMQQPMIRQGGMQQRSEAPPAAGAGANAGGNAGAPQWPQGMRRGPPP